MEWFILCKEISLVFKNPKIVNDTIIRKVIPQIIQTGSSQPTIITMLIVVNVNP